VVTETTIGSDESLLQQFVTPESVMEMYRNVVANRLAR
jgi:hypothetical protein